MATTPSKNPAVAGILSGLMPGLGQWYCRQWGKGTAFFISMIVTDVATGLTSTMLDVLASRQLPEDMTKFLTGSLFLLMIAAWSVIDAVGTAQRS